MEYSNVPGLAGASEVTVMKIIHIISGLKDGGAEGALYRLICTDRDNVHIVISLTDQGKYGSLIEKSGCDVFCLNMKTKVSPFGSFYLLIRLLKKHKPDVVQTWMYHADLIGGVAARLAGVKKIFWGIRHSDFDKSQTSLKTRMVARVCSWFSYIIPDKIVCCANKALKPHLEIGYKNKFVVIPNGYEYKKINNDLSFKMSLIEGYERNDSIPLIGMVGRYNYQKDHSNLIKALSILKGKGVRFYCVLVGEGIDSSNLILQKDISDRKLNDDIFLLGQRNDIPDVMSALDLHILSSSSGEAFPNVVAEAMLYNTPCVVTDVGDAAFIVDKFGWVVKPKDPQLLADSIEIALNEREFHSLAWRSRKQACHDRIVDCFSLEAMATKYREVWEK